MADEHFSMDGVGPQGGSIGMTFGVAGAASTVVGLAADFAQPFGPIALYILLFAGGFTALIALFYLLIRYLRPKLRSPFVFLGVLTLVAGIMVLFQQMAGAEGDDRGALAVLVKPLAQLQDDMGLVKKDIAAIKKSTQRHGNRNGADCKSGRESRERHRNHRQTRRPRCQSKICC